MYTDLLFSAKYFAHNIVSTFTVLWQCDVIKPEIQRQTRVCAWIGVERSELQIMLLLANNNNNNIHECRPETLY